MNKLTDLEICQCISGIEGVLSNKNIHDGVLVTTSTGCKTNIHNYNPLTDKALCFDLMVKHEITLCKDSICESEYGGAFWCDKSRGIIIKDSDKNPQRAICLAIIAKHNGENND